MSALDVGTLFGHLDAWRHLSTYRLETRADVYFRLFLPFALDDRLRPDGIRIDPRIISEFPLGQAGSRHFDKADFFAVSTNRKQAFLVELKTEQRAIRELPKAYLTRAADRGLDAVAFPDLPSTERRRQIAEAAQGLQLDLDEFEAFMGRQSYLGNWGKLLRH